MRRRLGVLAAVCAVVLSCEATPVEPLPPAAVAFGPNPAMVEHWWYQVEQCSGRRGDLSRVRFYMVPDAASFEWKGQQVIGLWMERGNRIVLASDHAFRAANVRHEMLHALLRVDGHPPEYFRDRCGAIVDHVP